MRVELFPVHDIGQDAAAAKRVELFPVHDVGQVRRHYESRAFPCARCRQDTAAAKRVELSPVHDAGQVQRQLRDTPPHSGCTNNEMRRNLETSCHKYANNYYKVYGQQDEANYRQNIHDKKCPCLFFDSCLHIPGRT